MITFKCKMCGGDLHPEESATTCECEYCGSVQTIPTADNEKKGNLFNRANRLRMAAEYDKAAAVYTSITAEFPEEAEAYWGLCLCKYGIEYVEDPATAKKIPTCHRTRSESIMDDPDFEQACENADAVAKKVYREEAKAIDRLQQDILSVVANESPYDVFICYKETGEDGERTEDSVLAQDIYDALTAKGLNVFFARITLEDKLGQQYEPYIYAALHSAKVMLAIGTQFEYYDAVWVKNEWARFLDMMKSDKTKALIPCYKDIDAYDMPREFKNLQAQDMGKLGWLQDLTRGVMKLCGKEEKQTIIQQAVMSGSANVENLMKRARLFMEDGDWSSANEYLDKVLDEKAEYAPAYVGKVQALLELRGEEEMASCLVEYERSSDWQKALRFATPELRKIYESYVEGAKAAREEKRKSEIYAEAVKAMENAFTQDAIMETKSRFESIPGYRDADALAEQCTERAEEERRQEETRQFAIAQVEAMRKVFRKEQEEKAAYDRALVAERSAKETLENNEREIEHLKAEQNQAQSELLNLRGIFTGKRRKELENIIEEKKRRLNTALSWTEKLKKRYDEARTAVPEVHAQTFADERELAYQSARIYFNERIYDLAVREFIKIPGYKDADVDSAIAQESIYQKGKKLLAADDNLGAYGLFSCLGDYKDAASERKALLTILQDKVSVYLNRLSAGGLHTVGLKEDGTVVAVGNNMAGICDVGDWTDIVAVSASSWWNTVGLKADGTVVAVGDNKYGQCDVGKWRDIVAVSAGNEYTVGLKADSTVVAVGDNEYGQCDVGKWSGIVALSAGDYHAVALKADGMVVAVGYNEYGQCDVGKWSGIVALSAGNFHTVALKADGTVVAVGDNKNGQCDVGKWRDIVAVSAGSGHTVGLKADGTVVAVGDNKYGECDVGDWTNIVAVSAGGHTVGLKSDGTVVAVGSITHGKCDVSKCKLW